MSELPVAPVAATAVSAKAAPAPKALNAIQLLEQELVSFVKQREQSIANVHAAEGAIQATQFLLGKLKAEAAKAESEGKKLLGEAESAVSTVEGEASKVIDFVKKEV